MDHTAQLQRITTKLAAARKADSDLKVFGATHHQYRINPPASEQDVLAFEQRYSIQLPACYRAFITSVGNGGTSFDAAAAGPFYGIFLLGENLNELVQRPELFLSQPAILQPEMTSEEWAAQIKRLNEDGTPDQEYEEELGRIYSGILPIGSQGCSSLHALVLNGPHAGKVVNLNTDRDKPKFAFEQNFLDWYERWLDEVISGYLSRNDTVWFGYAKPADSAQPAPPAASPQTTPAPHESPHSTPRESFLAKLLKRFTR
ncbi:SMI1/KNR4 family protein [Luteolibacter soli]|uniref:SMI1/KNR4 family protein n=1 Tax=Luteolibacter soli TaxID=3135280 RepID=A0ABU9AUR9_9BACT